MGINHKPVVLILAVCMSLSLFPNPTNAQLKQGFYKDSCPNVEAIVQKAVKKKFDQTFVTVPATVRLFFHDCFVTGCDASTMIGSNPGQNEKDHEDNLSLAGDGFDTVNKAKEAVKKANCTKVSCADILALATRDAIVLAGGKWFPVELGRFDALTSTKASVNGKLPKPTFKLDQLNAIFKANGLNQTDMIALSAGGHTVGFSHCKHVFSRIDSKNPDPTVNKTYLKELRASCPKNVDSRIAINMDPETPKIFDNQYFKNLQQRRGLFTSDQDLWEDKRSKATVNKWASDPKAFNTAFAEAMKKLGRVGVKTSHNGNIRRKCDIFN